LALPTTVAEPLVDRARRVIATLFVPASGVAFGGLRGSSDASTRIYEAGELTVTVGPGETSGSLFGLVVVAGQAPESLEGRSVRLTPREGAPISSSLDDLGNFEFAGVESGLYALEIDLTNGVVVIEELRVD
jgi:hypothetical protein